MNDGKKIDRLAREAETAMAEARQQSLLCRAWQALHQTDGQGRRRGPLPYTDEAIQLFEQALSRDPDNPRIIHHLAICTHARAWDLEIREHPDAARQWRRALDYWRQLIKASAFWQELADKLALCRSGEDTDFVRKLRASLYEQLLDIHIDFIRSYMEKDRTGSAARHIEIILQARIPPAVRKRLDEKLFAAMTGVVPRLRTGHDFSAALGMVEQFMDLVVSHLPALQLYLELCAEWLETLSPVDDRSLVAVIAGRAEPVARSLAAHPALDTAPLARPALEKLALSLVRCGLGQARHHAMRLEKIDFNQQEYDLAGQGADLAIQWGRLTRPHVPASSEISSLQAVALNTRAILMGKHEIPQVVEATVEDDIKLDTMVTLCKKCVVMLEEAVSLDPDDATLQANLDQFRQQAEQVEQLALLANFRS